MGTLRRYLADPDPNVRSAAVKALRLIPGTEVDALLAQVIARDAEAPVRRAGVDALRSRNVDAGMLEVLAKCLRGDPEPHVRLGVVGVLTGAATSSPQARELLSWASTHDADTSVREAAARALNPNAGKAKRGSH